MPDHVPSSFPEPIGPPQEWVDEHTKKETPHEGDEQEPFETP